MDPPPTHNTINHPDSANSSDAWDDQPLPPCIPGAKLRLMCSYGGHIIPRPHDKSLCYVGGDTRIVVVDRHSSLADFHSRLSHALLNGRHFTLKYQLPNEDLDSLISLATEEDLENMIEEYDRTTSASPLKPSRLRLFLFPSKPETAASMGCLLDDAKSETWFVDALNGAGLLPRGISDSAAIDNLLELEQGIVNSDSCTDDIEEEAQNESSCLGNNNKQVVIVSTQEVAVMETNSSFGSSSSSPSMSNLPPIKVRVEDCQMVGLDEQFSRHVSIASSLPPYGVSPSPPKSGDDEKSEHPPPRRKPPLPLQPVQRKFVDIHNLPSPDSKHSGAYNFPSPDSVKSDCSIASAGSLSKHTIYQDVSQFVNRENRAVNVTDQKMMSNIVQDPITSQQQQQQQQQQKQLVDSISAHQNEQQLIQHPNTQTHYIQHSGVPMSSYYPIYMPSPQTHQQPIQHQTHHDPQQYPMYFVPRPLTQTQPPPPKSNTTTTTNTTQMLPSAYQTTTQMMVQVPAHQFHQQYVAHPQMAPPPPQPNASVNYGYEYAHHMQDQMYYAQHMAATASQPPPHPHYQTMTPASAIFSQPSPGDNNNAQQS